MLMCSLFEIISAFRLTVCLDAYRIASQAVLRRSHAQFSACRAEHHGKCTRADIFTTYGAIEPTVRTCGDQATVQENGEAGDHSSVPEFYSRPVPTKG
jgi:hypothetical protein